MKEKKKCNSNDIVSETISVRKSPRYSIYKTNSVGKKIYSSQNSKKQKNSSSKPKRLQGKYRRQKRENFKNQQKINKEGIKNTDLRKKNYYIRGTLPKLKSVILQGEKNNLFQKFVNYESPVIELIRKNKILTVQNCSSDTETETDSIIKSLNNITVLDNSLMRNSEFKYSCDVIVLKRDKRLKNSIETTKDLIAENLDTCKKLIDCETEEKSVIREDIDQNSRTRRTIKKSFSPNNPCVLLQRSQQFLKNIQKEYIEFTKMETIVSDNTKSINIKCDESLENASTISISSIGLEDTSFSSESSKENDCTVSSFEKKKNLKLKNDGKSYKTQNQIKTIKPSNERKKINATEIPISPKQFNSILKQNVKLKNNNNNIDLSSDYFDMRNMKEIKFDLKELIVNESFVKNEKNIAPEENSLKSVKPSTTLKRRNNAIRDELDDNYSAENDESDIHKPNKKIKINKKQNIDNLTVDRKINKLANRTTKSYFKNKSSNKTNMNDSIKGEVINLDTDDDDDDVQEIRNENWENESSKISTLKDIQIEKKINVLNKKINYKNNSDLTNALSSQNLKKTNSKMTNNRKNLKINNIDKDDRTENIENSFQDCGEFVAAIDKTDATHKENIKFENSENVKENYLNFKTNKEFSGNTGIKDNMNFEIEINDSIADEIVEQIIDVSFNTFSNEKCNTVTNENLNNISRKRLSPFSPTYRNSKYMKLENSTNVQSLNCSSSSKVTEEDSHFLKKSNVEESDDFISLSGFDAIKTVCQTNINLDLEVLNASKIFVNENQAMDYNLNLPQKSPLSTSSTNDSAKGSSIDVEMDFPVIVGDIFWGRISSHPYWPCIVFPDHENRTVSVRFLNRYKKNQLLVHVRFFADNGRRSWIPKTNMMPYKGREDFERLCEESSKISNKKSCISKGFVIPKRPLWAKAIEEADKVQLCAIEIRCSEFEKILNDNCVSEINSKRKSKRNRSPTPESPAFEPIDDLKLFMQQNTIENNLNSENNNNSSNELIPLDHNTNEIEMKQIMIIKNVNNENEYEHFYEFLKPYILCGNENNNNLLENVFSTHIKELWSLRNISKNTLTNCLSSGIFNSSYKSSRLSSYKMRKLSLQLLNSSTTAEATTAANNKNDSTDKSKRKSTEIKSRLIDVVVDDILELEDNYLFRDLENEPICKICKKPSNLKKCLGSCCSWLHVSCLDENPVNNQQNEKKSVGRKKKKTKIVENMENKNINSDKLQNSETPNIEEVKNTKVAVINEKMKSIDSEKNESTDNEKKKSADDKRKKSTDDEEIYCLECSSGAEPVCVVCTKDSSNSGETPVRCTVKNCGEYFHIKCLKYWPQAKVQKSSSSKIESFMCPRHTCHTCVCDDPRGKFLKVPKNNTAKCIECPATYHLNSLCIPAGTQFITSTYIICPRHYEKGQDKIVNANWCFICATGGTLICCETCPTAFHLDCLKITQSDESYICEECETGRLPLYGELVWVKLGSFRWWPAIIIPPPEVPLNINRMEHKPNEFCVRFFGSHDHAWVYRSKVFLYQSDDWGRVTCKTGIDKSYQEGLSEARRISSLLMTKRSELKKTNNTDKQMAPLPYKKLKANRAVKPVKIQELDISELTGCNCSKFDENPCGLNSNCINRILYVECNPKLCPAGKECQNQMFESKLYPNMDIFMTEERGWGLKCLEPITASSFIIEYVGEIIDDAEFKRRIAQKQEERDQNYYFLTIENNYTIDAGRKGNLSRFINHSCEPNCRTQKWNVNGVTRIGLFAIENIPADTELTFDYNLQNKGNVKQICKCGANSCTGFIGEKNKERMMVDESETQKSKKQKKTKQK